MVEIKVTEPDEIDEAEAKRLASVCRGEFSLYNFKGDTDEVSHLLTIEDDKGELLAFLMLHLAPYDIVAYIRYLCVSKRAKGAGLSKALLAKAEELAKEGGKTHLELELVNYEPKLRKVYTDAGFGPRVKPKGELPRVVDALLMEKVIAKKPTGGRRKNRTRRNRKQSLRKKQ